MTTYRWKPIEDLPQNWSDLESKELEGLSAIWKEQSERLQTGQALRQFNEQLSRKWAIETGIIENLYSIDRGITQILIEKGIEASLIPHDSTDKPVEQILPILRDQEEVLEGLFDFVSQRRDLSTSYIKQLHQALTRHQETVEAVNGMGRLAEVKLIRGDWKTQPNNPTRPNGEVHEYCPPEHVTAEMDQLIALHQDHVVRNIPPEVEAAWLHHRFTQIHPFQDGNGRVARALASLIFLREKWFPLVIDRDIREDYIEALETADRISLNALVELFAKIQKRAFLQALSLSEIILQDSDQVQEVISAAAEKLKERKRLAFEQMQGKSFTFAGQVEIVAKDEFDSVAKSLTKELKTLDPGYFALAERSTGDNEGWFKQQIVQVAKETYYFADTRTYGSWVRLKIQEERRTEIVLSFHGLGVEFFGIMAVSAFLEYRDRSEVELGTSVDGPYRLSDDVFQFSHKETEQEIVGRFRKWLKEVLLEGLNMWRRQL